MIVSSNNLNLHSKVNISMNGLSARGSLWSEIAARRKVQLDADGLPNERTLEQVYLGIGNSLKKLNSKIEQLDFDRSALFMKHRPWTEAAGSPEATSRVAKIERFQNARIALYKLKERLGLL